MLVGAPGLHRAVAECTQPHGPPAGPEVSKALQKYLADPKCTDTVYKALLNRAAIEPKSEVVVQKVVGVLKQFLPRHVPSKDVLSLIDEFCTNLALGLSVSGLKKSLGYVKATIKLLQSPSGWKQTTTASVSRPDASPGRQTSVIGTVEAGEGESTPGDLQRARSLYTMTSVENGQVAPAASDAHSVDILPSAVMQRLAARREREDPHPVTAAPPDWAIPASVFPSPPTTGVRPTHLKAWAHLLPQYHHSLQLLLSRSEDGRNEMDFTNSHDTLWDLTGQEPEELIQHLEELTSLCSQGSSSSSSRKQKPNMFFCTQPYSQAEPLDAEPSLVEAVIEAVLGVMPPPSTVLEDSPQGRPSAGVWAASKQSMWEPRGNLPSVGQMCFSILLKLIMDMYVSNGPLLAFPLTQRLLSQGLRHPTPSIRSRVFSLLYNLAVHSIGFDPPTTDPTSAPQDSPPRASPGNTPLHTPHQRLSGVTSDGVLAGSWRPSSHPGVGPSLSALHTPPPSPLLQGSASPATLRATPLSAPHLPHYSVTPQGVAPSDKEVRALHPRGDDLKRWLLMLLYQILTEMAEMEEGSEEVWQAALGCVLFLTTQSGCFVRSAVEPFPMEVLSQLLRACLHFGWSMELYCHLLHLTCYLLTSPPLEVNGSVSQMNGWYSLDTARLDAFGGPEELLFHFCEAPTHHSRRETLCVLLLAIKPDDMSQPEVDATREVICAHRPLPDILQVAIRSPLPGLANSILAAMHDLIQHVPASAVKLLNRLEKLALGFLESRLAANVESRMSDVLEERGPDALYRAWKVLQEVVESGDISGSKLAAYCVTRLLQANSQDFQDALLLPSPTAAIPDSNNTQHPQQQIIQVIRALLEECVDGVSIFVDMVCQLILTFKEEALRIDVAETPSSPQPAQPSEGERLLIAHAIMNTWTAALEWLLTCSSVPPSILFRVSDMVLSTLTCLPGNPLPPILQEPTRLSAFNAAERMSSYRDREGEVGWDSLDKMLLPDLVLQGHMPFYVPCLKHMPLQCLVMLLRSFPTEQTSIQRLLLGRPSTAASTAPNPLNVPWHDSFSASRVACLLALVCGNAHAEGVTHIADVLEPLIDCNDIQVQHLVSVQILKHWFQHNSAEYWQVLQKLLLSAQHRNDEKMLINPYLQVSTILKMGQVGETAPAAG